MSEQVGGSTGPLSRPGDVVGMPKLVIHYPTDAEAVAALLPPGLDPCGEPEVRLSVYCVPVHGEPEHGISTRIPARFGGTEGGYCLGIGIDQESAIFISRETNGQPKFPCTVRFHRLGDEVQADATHQGTRFFSYQGRPAGGSGRPGGGTTVRDGEETTEHEWWIKASPAVGGGPGYDLQPMVVQVSTTGIRVHTEPLEGELVLRDSDWDPYTALLPRRGPARAELVTMRPTGRAICVAGTLDPDGFAPFADTIGGSRWPGLRGAPRRPPSPPGGAQ